MIRWFVVLLLVASLAGCEQRFTHKGPDVVAVPAGFVFAPGMSAYRNLFPDRPKLLERCYTTAVIADDDQSTIMITQYDGPTTAAQAESARGGQEQIADCGPIEPLIIERHEAWGWTETQPKGAPQPRARKYLMVASYPDATYLIEFDGTQERFLDHPEQLKQAVMTFKVSR